jgi:proline iminopeptidase
MDKTAGHNSAARSLYPPLEPFNQQMLDVGYGHKIYVEECGNPLGLPVVVLHGGPGGGCSPAMRRYFDPAVFRIVLFDQRGCGRSRPHASVENNTTWHLVADIEAVREALNITDWVVFGGSWGATLALIYAETHSDHVINLVLRGVFLMTQAELGWFYGGGAGQFWPELWAKFTETVPENERGDLIAAYHRGLFSGDASREIRYGQAWSAWENALASISSNGRSGPGPAQYARAFSRIENHYFSNAGFLEEDGQILRDIEKITHIPATIVQGRFDMICPPKSAQMLKDAWPKCELRMIPLAGHALSEPGISAELVRVTDAIAAQFK